MTSTTTTTRKSFPIIVKRDSDSIGWTVRQGDAEAYFDQRPVAMVFAKAVRDGIDFWVALDGFYGPEEGPTCSLCDGLGHGYPGAGPCPLEETGGSEGPGHAWER